MKEFELYIETLRRIASINYGKDVLFYNNGEWYSRDHCRNLTPEEVSDYVIGIVSDYERDIEERLETEDYIGLDDKNGVKMYKGDTVKYTKIQYTDCSREQIEKIDEPIIGEIQLFDGLWLGLAFKDGTGKIFMPFTVESEEFEVID